MEESLRKFMNESAKRHEENSNMIKKILASTDVAIRNQGASIKTLEIQIEQMSKSISTIDDTDTSPIRRMRSTRYTVSDPLNILADLGASVSVMPLSTNLNLGLGELARTKLTVELANRTVRHPKGIAENVLVGNLRRNQVDDLEPTVEEGEVINEPIIDLVKTRKFCVVTNFAVMENMDIYRDKEMGDVIIGEPFCMVSCVEARRFDGLTTIHSGDNNVTYQMVRSHPRFKHLSNEKCNKIPPLLKISAQDELNGISHSYQKLKTFYKGILGLGPEYIRDEKIVERLTRGHISVHEME
ncbi:hypothetical protein Tco_0149930 [Tanacetum coccineum]